MSPQRVIASLAVVTLGGLTSSCASSSSPGSTVAVSPASLPRIAKVSPRYQSYNVEMAEVIGGNFWKPYTADSIAIMKARAAGSSAGATVGVVGENKTMFQKRAPINLSNPRLRELAKALGPAYVRVSGSWANSVWFDDSDKPPPKTAPSGFNGVLTRAEWKGVIAFANATDAKLVTSFAISSGVRNAKGVWTPVQAHKLIAYTRSIGGHIAAAEFFNEPDMPEYGGAPKGYDAADYARDFAVFREFAGKMVPDMLIVGPGSVGEGVLMPRMSGGLAKGVMKTRDILSATPKPVFDVFSYHFYGAASLRCASMGAGAQTTPTDALSEAWLARTDAAYDFYVKGLRNQYEPGKPVWITETADAACGGNPWAKTFLDSFRYLDQLGRLAKRGVAVVFHNTLASSEYGLLDSDTFEPRPNYWAALLWHRLMGQTVLDVGASRAGLHLYAQCSPRHPGGVTLLAINNSRDRSAELSLPMQSTRYTLSAPQLESTSVMLNGRKLALDSNDRLPSLEGTPAPSGRLTLAPATISFFAFTDANNPHCH